MYTEITKDTVNTVNRMDGLRIMINLELTEQDLRTRGGILDEILDNTFDAAIIVDRNGIIIHCSKGSTDITKYSSEMLRGTPITKVDSQSPFDEVIKTGKAIFGLMVVMNGRKCMTNLIPIVSGNKVIGVLGTVLFNNMSNLKKILASLNEHLDSAQSQKNMYDILARVDSNYTFDDFIGESKSVKDMLEYCKDVSRSLYPILIIGETGTGKEILASAFHSATMANTFTPFVKINCSAIPKELLESELFGHEKGAFTGATVAKKGKFELASGGTLLLDEIGDMDLSLQSKLLRVIEEKEYERVGGNMLIPLNARIIASTNQDLRQRIKDGRFRIDLYYRLNTIEIDVPPLRERAEDIPLLINHFLKKNSMEISFDKEAMAVFIKYEWPGNVRELRNVMNRFSLKAKEGSFGSDAVRSLLNLEEECEDDHRKNSSSTMEDHAKILMIHALESSGYNISQAAKNLGISRSTLYSKIRKYNLSLSKNLGARP